MPLDADDEENPVSLGTLKVKKQITLLRSPKATFVSLVPNGANQRPFRVLKSASGKPARKKTVRKLDLTVSELINNGGNKSPQMKRIFVKKRIPKGAFVTLTKTLRAEGHRVLGVTEEGVIFKHAETGAVLVRKGFLSAAKRIAGAVGGAVLSGAKRAGTGMVKLARKAKVLHARKKSRQAKAARAVLSKLPESHKKKIRNKLHTMVLEHTMETIDRSHRRGAKAPALKNKKLLAGLHEYESALGPVRGTGHAKKRKPKAVRIVKPKVKAKVKTKAKKKASNIVPFKKPAKKKSKAKAPAKAKLVRKKKPAAVHEEEGGFGAFLRQRHAA